MRNLLLALVVGLAALALPTLAAGDLAGTELVPGTAVLLSQSGATSSTSTMTNIFAPSAYLDYHRFGSEPSVVVDRYVGGNDNVYSCGPLGVGFPGFSYFFRSTDLGATWRLPLQDPIFGKLVGEGQGGGDCHVAVGQVTHRVFFVDLSGPDETINVSDDGGRTFTSAPLGSGLAPGTIDDRPWLAVDELYPACRRSTTPSSTTPSSTTRRSRSRSRTRTARRERMKTALATPRP